MIVRDHGQGGRWYVVTVSYPTPLMAKRAWERCERKLDMSVGDAGIGLYRLTAAEHQLEGPLATGIPTGAHAVAAVTRDSQTARKTRRLLNDGIECELRPSFADALITRRARVVLAHAGETGRLIIRRPQDRGAKVDPFGGMHEHKPGHG